MIYVSVLNHLLYSRAVPKNTYYLALAVSILERAD